MQQSYKDIILQILDIIIYSHDKESFIDEFERLNREETIVNLLDKLPEDIKMKIKDDNDLNELKKYISREEYTAELTKVYAESLGKFIDDIAPSLNEEQKDKISDIIFTQQN